VPFSVKAEGAVLHPKFLRHSALACPMLSAIILEYAPRIQHLTGCHGSPHEGLRCRPGRWRKDAVAQEVGSGSPIGLPFDQFQPMEKSFRWPVAPDERQPGAHGRFILEQPLNEAS